MNEEDKVTEPETDQEQTEQEQSEQEQSEQEQPETSLEKLTETITALTKQIEKLEKMNQNLLIQQHVDDVDDSKLFSIFNRYNRKR